MNEGYEDNDSTKDEYDDEMSQYDTTAVQLVTKIVMIVFVWSIQIELLNLLALFYSFLLTLILFFFLSERQETLVTRLNMLGVWIKFLHDCQIKNVHLQNFPLKCSNIYCMHITKLMKW